MSDKLLKISDVADRLSIGVRTAYRLIEEGQLKALRIGSGRGTLRIAPSDLQRYLNRPQTNGIPVRRGGLFDD